MKIVIITQEDSFVIPRNIEKLINLDFVKIIRIVDIDSPQSLVNRKDLFIKGFGLYQSAKMGFRVISNKLINIIDSIFNYRLPLKPKGLKSVAQKHKIPYQQIRNPNEKRFIEQLALLAPDLIVSYSAPLIFKKELLTLPEKGCINLHCSHLPDYAGVMPSFWALYNKEKATGVSVHYMDSKIDNGKILGQKKVEIFPGETMFQLIEKTKNIGGDVMCEVLRDINSGTVIERDNEVDRNKYFSWPTIENFKDFRNRGGRLI